MKIQKNWKKNRPMEGNFLTKFRPYEEGYREGPRAHLEIWRPRHKIFSAHSYHVLKKKSGNLGEVFLLKTTLSDQFTVIKGINILLI